MQRMKMIKMPNKTTKRKTKMRMITHFLTTLMMSHKREMIRATIRKVTTKRAIRKLEMTSKTKMNHHKTSQIRNSNRPQLVIVDVLQPKTARLILTRKRRSKLIWKSTPRLMHLTGRSHI